VLCQYNLFFPVIAFYGYGSLCVSVSNKVLLFYRYSDGVDLNCGCPQRWAVNDGYGVDLLRKPHLIRDLVLQVKNRIPGPYTVSVKLRILEDLR